MNKKTAHLSGDYKKIYLVVAALVAASPLVVTECWGASNPENIDASKNTRTQLQEHFELVILFDNVAVGASESEIIEQVNSNSRMIPIAGVGRPTSANFLIHNRKRSARKTLPFMEHASISESTAEERLQKYIVLNYPNLKSLEAAKKALQNNPNIISVKQSATIYPLSYTNEDGELIPNDPYATPQGGTIDRYGYQWGLETMNFYKAWNITTGNAYIGIPEYGLSDSPEVRENYLSHMSKERPATVDEGINVIHGTHVTGIIAGGSDDNTGTAGICWDCSYSFFEFRRNPVLDFTYYKAYLSFAHAGVQVVNSSFGVNALKEMMVCRDGYYDDMCEAIDTLEKRDIIIVASAGNGDNLYQPDPTKSSGLDQVDYPAKFPHVIAVGATNGEDVNPTDGLLDRAVFSNYGESLDFLAPGHRILSTVPNGQSYSYYYVDENGITWPSWDLGDDAGSEVETWSCEPEVENCESENNDSNGYGTGTGTSFAAPHITGLIGLIRSVNPLLTTSDVREVLRLSAEGEGFRIDDKHGYGVPDAAKALEITMGSVNGNIIPNRLTPLFEFYNETFRDSFYTIVPQMATAARCGTMHPNPFYVPISESYKDECNDYGNTRCPNGSGICYENSGDQSNFVNSYRSFPGIPVYIMEDRPRAKSFVFTTANNPLVEGERLLPLYRFSRQAPHQSNQANVDHIYATSMPDPTEDGSYSFDNISGYLFDGIEGYVFPPSTESPELLGLVPLKRGHYPADNDHALFIGEMVPTEYNNEVITLGYTYLNRDTDGDHLIDGFELLIGTNPLRSDTDYDGISDGVEFPPHGIADFQSNPIDINHFDTFIVTCEKFGRFCTFRIDEDLQDSGLIYTWNFGDGSAATVTSNEVTHQYADDGVFTASISIKDPNSAFRLAQTDTVSVVDMSWLIAIISTM